MSAADRTSTAPAASARREGGFAQRALAWIEKAGNKVPNPAILFIALCIGVIVLSQILDWLNVSVTSEVVDGDRRGGRASARTASARCPTTPRRRTTRSRPRRSRSRGC